EGRSGSLWNDVDFIKANFVPVAIDNWYTEHRPDSDGRFDKLLAGGSNGSISNSLRIATPSGKTLSGDPKDGLAKWKALPEAERKKLPDLGGYDPSLDRQPPPGCLILDVYARPLTGAD